MIFAFNHFMKMTANIPRSKTDKSTTTKVNNKLKYLLSTKWKLVSIYETGITSDEAKYKDVDMVFSSFHIYVMFGNRVEQYKYKFISPKSFLVKVEGVDVKCMIKEINENNFVFHADFNGHYFILELVKSV